MDQGIVLVLIGAIVAFILFANRSTPQAPQVVYVMPESLSHERSSCLPIIVLGVLLILALMVPWP